MDGYSPFRPGGRTAMLAGSSLSPLATLQMSTAPSGDITYLISNRGTVDAAIGYGPSSGVANGNAVYPGAGQATDTLFLAAGSIQSFTLTPMLFFAAVTPTGNAAIFITPGRGS